MNIFKPIRTKHDCEQLWMGARAEIFPLLCPVKEKDWTPGWDPKLVISSSGVIEQECIFVEPDTPNDAIWIVTHYDPANFEVAMYRIVPGVTVGKFSVTLDNEKDNITSASVSYEQTALSQDGEKIVSEFTAQSFTNFMNEFKLAIDYYLTTGKMIDGNELAKQEASIHH